MTTVTTTFEDDLAIVRIDNPPINAASHAVRSELADAVKAVDDATHPWHVPMGVVSHTGTGLFLTGGVGYLCKAHGASSDSIREVTIVTSDGTVHVCSAEQEPDLFFAVRGAAPNLGIVTEVKAQATNTQTLCAPFAPGP